MSAHVCKIDDANYRARPQLEPDQDHVEVHLPDPPPLGVCLCEAADEGEEC